jgi:hypothetical protein
MNWIVETLLDAVVWMLVLATIWFVLAVAVRIGEEMVRRRMNEHPEYTQNELHSFWDWVKWHGARWALLRMWSNMNAEYPDTAWAAMYEYEIDQDTVPAKIKEWVSWLYIFKMRPSLAGSENPMFMPDGFGPELIDMVKWVEDNQPCAIEDCGEHVHVNMIAYGLCKHHADEYGAYES